jgi:hypothetical protein
MVTGEPGSGKTTLSQHLSRELRLPHLSRDAVRGGLLATSGLWTGRLDGGTRREAAVDALVDIVEAGAAVGVSFLVEFVVAAGREEAWERLQAAASVLVIVVESELARERAEARDRVDPLLTRPGVLAALGYASMDAFMASSPGSTIRDTMRTDFELPTLRVRTDNGYDPEISSIVEWVVDQTRSS